MPIYFRSAFLDTRAIWLQKIGKAHRTPSASPSLPLLTTHYLAPPPFVPHRVHATAVISPRGRGLATAPFGWSLENGVCSRSFSLSFNPPKAANLAHRSVPHGRTTLFLLALPPLNLQLQLNILTFLYSPAKVRFHEKCTPRHKEYVVHAPLNTRFHKRDKDWTGKEGHTKNSSHKTNACNE